MSSGQPQPRRIERGYPLPPCYYELFTDEAKANAAHPDHNIFTPPPPFGPNEAFYKKYNSPNEKESILNIRQTAFNENVIYTIPDTVPQSFRIVPRGHLARFHPDVDYKGELARMNQLLAQEYGYFVQIVSTPQPPTHDQNRPLLFDEHFGAISLIISNIAHLTGILREHQAKQQVLAHVKKQTALNLAKVERFNVLHQQFDTLLRPNCDVDEVLTLLSTPPAPKS